MTRLIRHTRLHALALAGLTYAMLTGCALNMPVPVSDPTPSSARYPAAQTAPATLYFLDQQSAEAKEKMVTGRIPMKPMYADQPLDSAAWLARNTFAELRARGLPATLASKESEAQDVVQIQLINSTTHRVSGFSPFETYTRLKADLVTPAGSQRLAFWIKRGKVPVWSFDEVIEPTFNIPLGLMSKDLAAQINKYVFKASFSDAQVDALVAKVESAGDAIDYRDVFELGFGNNRRAIPALVKLMAHGSDEISHAAISSLGFLDATEQFGAFKAMYESRGSDKEDRGIALKAICDLSSPEARGYATQQMTELKDKDESDARFFADILSLYL
ncbi:MAG: HEAT repeat domain-containing protein [Candidatus Dactylopiibacterium sp.]|nr:HEAT repeat domain-containing protein [Candidatus Dactylopiibacterium sp.]